MTVALSVAVGEGAEAVVCASTGNTSASMAAYAARAGVKPLVLVPQGKIAAGKLAQAIVHGAQVIMVRGNFDDCLRLSRGLADRLPRGAGQLGEPDAAPGAEDRVVRDRRLPRRRPRRPRPADRQRRQHLGVLAGLPRGRRRRQRQPQARDAWLAGCRRRAARRRRAGRRPGDPGLRDPHRQPRLVEARGGGRASSPGACSARSPTIRSSVPSGSWPPATVSSSSPRRPPASPGCSLEHGEGADVSGQHGRRHRDRSRAQGHRHRAGHVHRHRGHRGRRRRRGGGRARPASDGASSRGR